MPEPAEKTRCILFTPTGRGRSGDLTGQLRSRGWDPIGFSDPFLAMAELCLEDRTQSARTAWGLRPSRRLVLVVAPSPAGDFGEASPLVEAVHRYLPLVEVWRAGGPDLVSIPNGRNPAAPVAVRTAEPEAAAARRTRPTEPEDDLAPPAQRAPLGPDEADAEFDDAPVEITREEIDMLFALGDETREP